MSNIKFYFGQEEKVNNKAIEDGSVYITPDTKKIYIDLKGKRIGLLGSNSGDNESLQSEVSFVGNGELNDFMMRTDSLVNGGAGWNTCLFPNDWMLEETPLIYAWCENPEYTVQVKSPTVNSFLYQLVRPSIEIQGSPITAVKYLNQTTSDAITIRYIAISYSGWL